MTEDPKHTNVGCGFFQWPPYASLRRASADAAHLWQVLYMGRRAKTLIPGLWWGGVMTMADDGSMTLGETSAALVVLEEREMVEYDNRVQVLRLTCLPDRCERAPNQSCLRSWWDKRGSVPDCGVRDRHLDLMAWLHLPFRQKGAKGGSSGDMQMTWEATFGGALNTRSAPSGYPQAALPIPKASSPIQLDLYATPEKPHGGGHGGGHRPVTVTVSVTDTAEGELSERVCPQGPAGPADFAAARVVLDHPDHGFCDTCEPCLADRREHGHDGPLDLLQLAKKCLAGMVGDKLYDLWVDPLGGTVEGDVLHLTAPSTFHRDRIRDHYRDKLQALLRQTTGRAVQVAI